MTWRPGKNQSNAQQDTACHQGRLDGETDIVIEGKHRLLLAVGINHLAEIALLIEQSYPRQRHAEVTGRLEVISGVDVDAGVERQRLTKTELHTEVVDVADVGVDMDLAEKAVGFRVLAPLRGQSGQFCQ